MALVRRDPSAQPREIVPEPVCPDVLIERLADPDTNARREAALGLEGIEGAVPALLDRVGTEIEPAVRDAILTTLAAHDTAQVTAGLVPHLASDDAGLRTAVAEALATMREAVPEVLPGLVADPDPDVRIMTAMVLADLNHPAALSWLATMIRDDPHPNVVSAAIDALLPAAGPDHVALLERARDRFPEDPFLRFTVDAAVPRLIGAPR